MSTETVLRYVFMAVAAALLIVGVHLVLVPLGLGGSLLILADLGACGLTLVLWGKVWPKLKGLVGKG